MSVICYASRKNHRDLAGGPLYVYYTFYLSELLHENLYLVPASDIEKYLDCSDALLTGLGLDTTDIDFLLGKYLCDIYEQSRPVMTEYLLVCLILGTIVHEGCILPLCFYEPVLFYLGQTV